MKKYSCRYCEKETTKGKIIIEIDLFENKKHVFICNSCISDIETSRSH